MTDLPLFLPLSSGAQQVSAFDLRDPLPTGTVVLEASAGTGKTYTVGAIVTRYVAEGRATLDQLLVVTFGRAASQELRERVRDQLVAAARGLADPAAARAGADVLVALLAQAPDEEVARRRERLTRALADFDAATIATTHQFCQQVLTGLGIAGDSDAGATLVEDLDDLVIEVVDDLYVRRFAAPGAPVPPFDRGKALELGRVAVQDPQARLEPLAADQDSDQAMRRRFAVAVRAEVEVRKRRRGVLGYDDLLSRVADALTPQDAAARARMRARWTVVLIDEFQDTDPVQWNVLRRAFSGHTTLVLIGDPKQAIYAFRGGDVVTYLDAARTATGRATLARNWRTDAPLVAGLQVLLDGAELGDPDIVVRPVSAVHEGSRLAGLPTPDPLRLRVVTRPQLGKSGRAVPKIADVRRLIGTDLAHDVARVLGAGASFAGDPLVAGDVAVLVGTHAQAALIREALAAVGVPAVVAGAGSVYATPAGQDWLVLLEALEQPHRSSRVRAAALTPFLGWTASDLAAGGERATDTLGAQLRRWADLLATRGVAALLELASAEHGLAARVLGETDGERRLTDLRHVGQGLHAAAVDEGLGLAALVEWLRRRQLEAATDQSAERVRRLDSDAAAVQVLTLHASKGLQFPVVYLPFVADRWVSEADIPQLHEGTDRVLDVGGDGSPGRRERQTRALHEQAGEVLRLLYVGLTRAQSQVVCWWAPSTTATDSGLHRLLFGRTPGSPAVPDSAPIPDDAAAWAALTALQARGGPVLEAAVAAPLPAGVVVAPARTPFTVGVFDRVLDTAWRRASYSSLSAAGTPETAPGVSSEPETGERDDEAAPPGVGSDLADPAGSGSGDQGDDDGTGGDRADDGRDLRAIASPMAELPSGTSFGTLVHAVLETTDPRAADLPAELRARSREQLDRRASGLTATELADALVEVLATPLGPLTEGLALRDLSVHDRLTELDFELPLAGGDRPDAEVTLGQLAPLLRRHLPVDDPLVGYAERLESPEMSWLSLRGYLTGSLDVVLRLPGPRYLVADYKTNWLGDIPGLTGVAGVTPQGPSDAPLPVLSAWHYRPAAVQQAMTHSDYPLQALLYCVALHRYLRWRQPGYSAEQHLGGVLYLYVRGMCGASGPTVGGAPCGVFGWRPPGALVEALSTLLDEGAP